MIGTELLQLMQGDPLAQMRQQMAGPNPNPQMPRTAADRARAKAVTAGNRTWPIAARAVASAWNWTRHAYGADAGDAGGRISQYDSRPRAPGPRQRPAGPRRSQIPCRSLDRRPWPRKARQTWFHCTVA